MQSLVSTLLVTIIRRTFLVTILHRTHPRDPAKGLQERDTKDPNSKTTNTNREPIKLCKMATQ